MNAIFQLWTLPPVIVRYGTCSISAAGTISLRQPTYISHRSIITGTTTITANPYLIQRGRVTLPGTGQVIADIVVPLSPVITRGSGKVLAKSYVIAAQAVLMRGSGTLLSKTFFLSSTRKSVTWNTNVKVPVSQAAYLEYNPACYSK